MSKQNKKLTKRSIFEREGKKSNNGRDITDITFSLLALNTVLNSTIPFRIVMCWNGEKICLPSVPFSYSASYEMSLFNRRTATNFRSKKNYGSLTLLFKETRIFAYHIILTNEWVYP